MLYLPDLPRVCTTCGNDFTDDDTLVVVGELRWTAPSQLESDGMVDTDPPLMRTLDDTVTALKCARCDTAIWVGAEQLEL